MASIEVTINCAHAVAVVETTPITTPSTIIPRMSSNTAAPRMMRAGNVCRTRRSPSTRADADAGGHHGGSHKDRLVHRIMAQDHITEAQHERQSDPGESYIE